MTEDQAVHAVHIQDQIIDYTNKVYMKEQRYKNRHTPQSYIDLAKTKEELGMYKGMLKVIVGDNFDLHHLGS